VFPLRGKVFVKLIDSSAEKLDDFRENRVRAPAWPVPGKSGRAQEFNGFVPVSWPATVRDRA
jgi:hypothetical protein